MKKKFLLLLIPVALCAAAVSAYLLKNSGNSSNGPALVVSDTTAAVGSEVYVNVSIQENPGISGFVIDLEYDSKILKPLEIMPGDLFSQGLFDSSLTPQINDGVIKTTWFDVADVNTDGELYAVKFRVLANEKTKTPVTLHYQEGNIANQSLENVSLDLVDANVTIE